MRRIGLMVGVLAGLFVVGCSDDESGVPTRDQLVAEIVKSGGLDQATAECAADALFDNVDDADIAKIADGQEPSEAAQEAFTSALVECLMPVSTT